MSFWSFVIYTFYSCQIAHYNIKIYFIFIIVDEIDIQNRFWHFDILTSWHSIIFSLLCLSLFGAKNGAKNETCSIFSTKIAFFHPKQVKIWRCLEKCVPLHCQKRNDGIWAQGTKNYLSGLRKFTACPERKKEVLSATTLNIKH